MYSHLSNLILLCFACYSIKLGSDNVFNICPRLTKMTKHLTILLLILSALSYSSVWAMNSHDDFGVQEHGLSHPAASQDIESRHNLDGDHCCHAGIHLLGLFASNFDIEPLAVHSVDTQYSFYIYSHHNSPPQRPPLV